MSEIEVTTSDDPITIPKFIQEVFKEDSPKTMESLVIGYVKKDGSLRTHVLSGNGAHVIAIFGSLKTYLLSQVKQTETEH